jgi:hypothetical protein
LEIPIKKAGVFHKCDVIEETAKYQSKILCHKCIEIKLFVFSIFFDMFRGIKSLGGKGNIYRNFKDLKTS